MPNRWSSFEETKIVRYRVCPRCARAVPASSEEHYCINDGTWLLEQCPLCGTAIHSPYAQFCSSCGLEFSQTVGGMEGHQ